MQDPYVSDDEKNLTVTTAGKTYMHIIGSGLCFHSKSYRPIAAVAGNPSITTHIFVNQDYAFSRINGVNYQPKAYSNAIVLITHHFSSSLGYRPDKCPDAPWLGDIRHRQTLTRCI